MNKNTLIKAVVAILLMAIQVCSYAEVVSWKLEISTTEFNGKEQIESLFKEAFKNSRIKKQDNVDLETFKSRSTDCEKQQSSQISEETSQGVISVLITKEKLGEAKNHFSAEFLMCQDSRLWELKIRMPVLSLKQLNQLEDRKIRYIVAGIVNLFTDSDKPNSSTTENRNEVSNTVVTEPKILYGMLPLSNEILSSDLKRKIGDVNLLLKGQLEAMGIYVVETVPVTYHAVESPRMTLDPEYGDPVKEKLQKILKDKKYLQGLIFGHIREDWSDDNKLYVILRVYHPNVQGYKSWGQDKPLAGFRQLKIMNDQTLQTQIKTKIEKQLTEIIEKQKFSNTGEISTVGGSTSIETRWGNENEGAGKTAQEETGPEKQKPVGEISPSYDYKDFDDPLGSIQMR